MSYDGAGSLFALGIRVTKLSAAGAPLTGATNCYVSDALVKADIGLEYEDAKQVTQLNGTGLACVNFQAPYTLKRGSISNLQICQPDPNLLAFMLGGDVITDVTVPLSPKDIGYRAPQVGVEEAPNGFSIEMWTRAVIGSAYATVLPYLWWVLPRCYVIPAGNWSLAADSALLPEFSGYSIENAGWSDGPAGDWTWPSDRVWQYSRIATLPAMDAGFVVIP